MIVAAAIMGGSAINVAAAVHKSAISATGVRRSARSNSGPSSLSSTLASAWALAKTASFTALASE